MTAFPSCAKSWRGDVALLFAVYTVNYLDRQLLVMLAPRIGRQIGASGAEMAAVYGTAFGVMFGVAGLFLGPLSAAYRRLHWTSAMLLLWSVGVAGVAFAHGLAGLWLSRIVLAAGEAAALPAIFAYIGDAVPPRRWALAGAIVIGGAFLGAGLAFVLGGIAADAANPAAWRYLFAGLALVGLVLVWPLRLRARREPPPVSASVRTLPSWPAIAALTLMWLAPLLPPARMTVAALAIGLAAILLWLRDFLRRDPDGAAHTIGAPAFRLFLLAFAAVLFADTGLLYWLPQLVGAHYPLTSTRIGLWLGGLMIGLGAPSAILAGWWGDRLSRSHRAGRVDTVIAALAIEAVGATAAIIAPGFPSFLVAYALLSVGSGAWVGLASAIGLQLLPAAHRPTATSLYFLATVYGGVALGPLCLGAVAGWAGSIADAFLLLAPVGLVALICLLRLRRHISGSAALFT